MVAKDCRSDRFADNLRWSVCYGCVGRFRADQLFLRHEVLQRLSAGMDSVWAKIQ